jgi:CxxC motif-containing protein (DUF1111 family)
MCDTPKLEEAAEGGLRTTGLFAVALPDTRGRHCYLTDGDGDPPRTYTPEHATSYPTRLAAAAAIIEARKRTPFRPRTMIVVSHPANDQRQETAGK